MHICTLDKSLDKFAHIVFPVIRGDKIVASSVSFVINNKRDIFCTVAFLAAQWPVVSWGNQIKRIIVIQEDAMKPNTSRNFTLLRPGVKIFCPQNYLRLASCRTDPPKATVKSYFPYASACCSAFGSFFV